MPHVVVKMYTGRTEEKKKALTDALSKAMIESIGVGPETISIEIMEFAKDEWPKKVYKPEILDRMDKLSVKPGYRPSDEEMGIS